MADVVYTNGKIYTVDKEQPWAEAVAIKDGKFLVVGSKADADAVAKSGHSDPASATWRLQPYRLITVD